MNSKEAVPNAELGQQSFRTQLLTWYDAHARALPWRENRDPYRVWVSEIMLQQTRVAAVIAHYHEFLRRFPTVEKLARAREASVLAAWSGLGYYRRARMMHAAAKVVARELDGKFPETAEGLRELPGVGRYTAAAIASIAFGEPVAVADGNVERVLQRVLGKRLLGGDFWIAAEELLDRERPGDFNQALMELGATVCAPRAPGCLTCPVVELCASRGELPLASKPIRQKKREVHFTLYVRNEEGRDRKVFLVQRPRDASLMAGMWELPEIPPLTHERVRKSGALSESIGGSGVKQIPPLRFALGRNDKGAGRGKPKVLLFTVRHSITVTDYTVRVWKSSVPGDGAGRWIAFSRLPKLAMTGLARKILTKAGVMPTRARATCGGVTFGVPTKSPLLIVVITLCLLASLGSFAQDSGSTDEPQSGVVLVSLSPPTYPPLARQARIAGDVKLYVHVRKDGTVESVELYSGHPMLAPVAVESARKSQFDCRACGDEVSSYQMIYTFGFLDDGKGREVVTARTARTARCMFLWKCGIERTTAWQCPENRPSETTESRGHVTIRVSTVCIQTEIAY